MAHVRVAVRVRPLSQREKEDGANTVITGSNGSVTIQDLRVPEQPGCDHRARYRQFRLDHCFFAGEPAERTADYQQLQVYTALGRPLLEETLAGFNCCLLAYGQSGSGKTHTMLGRPEYPGMMPRLCEELLGRLPAVGDEASIRLSCIEVYKETVRDLLGDQQKSLRIREHPKNGPYVEGLGLHRVTSVAVLRDLLSRGMARRQCGATQVNHSSSRSHALVTVHLRRRRVAGWVTSKLHLVDLAGSERAGAGPDRLSRARLTEGASINRSLVALGNVISALAEQSRSRRRGSTERRRRRRAAFVSYRSSVLTWLLKDSLGGNAKTAMVATVSPASTSYSDTLSTLRYAERAKAIVNTPVVNDEPGAQMVMELQAEVDRLRGLLALNKMVGSGVPSGADVASNDRSLRRSRTGRALASSLQHSSYQRLSASEPDLPSPRLEAPPASNNRRRQPLTRGQATELPETPAAERPSPIGAEETVRQPGTTTASSSQLSLLSADSELWDELRGIVCERERRCWANFLLWEQRRGLYRPASVPGNMQRLSEERKSRRQVVREVVRRLYPGGGGGKGSGGHGHGHAPPGDAAEPDWCCCGKRKRRREASTESRPYEKRSRLMEEADEVGEPVKRLRRRSSGDHDGRSPAVGAQSSSTPNVSRFTRRRPRAPDPTPAVSAPSSQRGLSQPPPAPRVATLSCSVDEGLGGSFDVCVPPTFSDDSLEPSDLGISQDSLDMIDADSVEDLTAGKRRIDSLFRPELSLPVVAAPVLVHQVEYRNKPTLSHRKSLPEVTGSRRKLSPEVTGHRRSVPEMTVGHRKKVPDTVIRISMSRPTVSSDSEWGSAASSPERRQHRTGRAEIRRRAEERFSCSGASDSEDEPRFVSATDRTAGDTLSLLTAEDASDSVSFHSAPGEPDRWSTCSERDPPSSGGPVIHFPSPPPPDVSVNGCKSSGPPASSPTAIVHPFRSGIDSGEFNGENGLSDVSPTAACRLYTIVESAGESDGAIDSRASAPTHAPPSAAPAMASKHSGVGQAASAASAVAGGRSVLERLLSGDRLPVGDAEWRRWLARQAAAAAPAAAGWIDADMWERYVSRLDVRSHLLLEEARRRPGLAVSLLVRSRSLPDLAESAAGGHVSRLFRSALSVTVHGRPPPQPEQRILYSLPPEVRERSTVGPPVECIPEDSDGASESAASSSSSNGSKSSGSASSSSRSDGSDAGSEDGSGPGGGGREPGDGVGEVEERVAAALDEEVPPHPSRPPPLTAGDLADMPTEADPFGSLSDAPPVFISSSGDGLNGACPSGQLAKANVAADSAGRAGEVVTSEASTERLTQRIETTETHRDASHSGPRILSYEIVEEVNVFVRGSGETRVSTSRSASVTRVPAAVEGGETSQTKVTSNQDMSVVGRPGEAPEQSSRTHKVWDYRTEVLHLSPKCRQVVTSTLDAEARVHEAPLARPEGGEQLHPAESGENGSEPPSLENWVSEEPPPVQQRQTSIMERHSSEQPPSLEPWAPHEAPNLTRQPSEQPPSLEPWAPDQPPSQESQPPSLEPWVLGEVASLTRQRSEQPPSLEPWAPEQPQQSEQSRLERQPQNHPLSLERRASDQPPSLEQWESGQPPSLEQWAPDQPPSSEQWAPGADTSPTQQTDSPPAVHIAAPLNIAEPPAIGAAAESLSCLGSVTASGQEPDGFHSDQPTAAELSPTAPFADTHGRVPPSPFRLIANVEDEEVQISSRQACSVSRVHPTAHTTTVVMAEHVTITSQELVMTSHEPAAPTAPLSTAAAVCDPQTLPSGDRPGPDRKAAAVVRLADESRAARPVADAPDIDARSFVDRQTSPESISGDRATGNALQAPQEIIDPDLDSGQLGRMESSAREHSLSPDKIERWSCDPPAIFIFEVEEHGALLRRDETRFIDADAGVDKPPESMMETQSQGAAGSPRSPRTTVEEQFFFFKTTEEEPSLETIEEEIVEAFDESSSSLSSSSSSSHSKNTSRDVDGESLRSDLTGVSGAYEISPSAVTSPDAGSPRQTQDQDIDPKELTEIADSSEKLLGGTEGKVPESDGKIKDEATEEPPKNESLNLMQLSSEESPREASDPVCGARDAADASEPTSGWGGTPSRSGASVSSNVQADRELEEVSGRLEVMSSSALFGKADSEGGESGTMAEPRSGSPRLPETPERPGGATQEKEMLEEMAEVGDGVQEVEQEQGTVPSDDNDARVTKKEGESEEAEGYPEVPAPREVWLETTPAVPELSHAVSVEECEEFEVSEEELIILPPMTTVVEKPLEMMSAEELWEEVTAGELSEVPKLPWRDDVDNETPDKVAEKISERSDSTDAAEHSRSAGLPQTFVDSSNESDHSLPPSINSRHHHKPPETSAPSPNEEASEPVTSANRSPAFEEARVTSPGIDPRGAPPAEPPIDADAAAFDPGQIEVGRATESAEGEMQDPAIEEEAEALCYPDDSLEVPEMELELLDVDGENLDRTEGEEVADRTGETHVAVEAVESNHQYIEVTAAMESVLCCPDATKEAPILELEQLESSQKPDGLQKDDQSNGETKVPTQTGAEVIEEDLLGPAQEETLVDILCYGDATSEFPTLELEQLDVANRAEGDDDAAEENFSELRETQQATEASEQESQGPVEVEESLTILCLAAHSTVIDASSERDDAVTEAMAPDIPPVFGEAQTTEALTEGGQNLQVEEITETIICCADDTNEATILELETSEEVDVTDGQISNDIEGKQLVSGEGEEHRAHETTVSGGHSPAVEVPSAVVLCFAGSEMMAINEEMEVEMLESDQQCRESPSADHSDSEAGPSDRDAFKLAGSIVSQVMKKAGTILECGAEEDADEEDESEKVRETKRDSSEEGPKETIIVTQLWNQSEEDESSERSTPIGTIDASCHSDCAAEKTSSEEVEQKLSKNPETADLSQDLLGQVVSAASEVHMTQHPIDFESEEKGKLNPDLTELQENPTSDEMVEPIAVRRSSYLCGSENSASEDEAGPDETKDGIQLANPAPHAEEAPNKELAEAAPSGITAVDHSSNTKASLDVEGSKAVSEVNPVELAEVAPVVIHVAEPSNVVEPSKGVESSEEIREIHQLEREEIALADIDVVERISTADPSGDGEGSEAEEEVHSPEVVVVARVDIDKIDHRNIAEPSRNVEGSESEAEVNPAAVAEVVPADNDVVEHSDIIKPDGDVGDSEGKPETHPDEVAPATAEVNADVVSQIVDSATKVHVSDILAALETEESIQAPPEQADSSNCTTSDNGTEPVAVRRSSYQCGSHQDDGEAVREQSSEHEEDSTSPRPDQMPASAEGTTKITIEDDALLPEAQTCDIATEEVQRLLITSTEHEHTNVDNLNPDTRKGDREIEEGEKDVSREEATGRKGTHQDASGGEENDDAVPDRTETEASELCCTMEILDCIESDSGNFLAQNTVELPETKQSAPEKEAEEEYSVKGYQRGSKQNDSCDESEVGQGEAGGLGSSHSEVVSVSEVERIELIGGEDMREDSITTPHTVVIELETSMLHELLSVDVKTEANAGGERPPEPLAHDLLGRQMPAIADTVGSCSPAVVATSKDAQQTGQPSLGARLVTMDVSEETEGYRQEGSKAPAYGTEEAAREGPSSGPLIHPTTAATSDELQCHLLEEVDEQTPSLDTIESVETGGRDDPEEIFYSFDTEDETTLDAMKAPQSASREVGSLNEFVDFTEVTITVTESKSLPAYSENEDNSEDSSSETPRISVSVQSSRERPDSLEPTKHQEAPCGTDQPETAKLTQATTELSMKTAYSEASGAKKEADHTLHAKDSQRNTISDDPHTSDGAASLAGTGAQHDREKHGTGRSTKQPAGACDAVCKEEAPLASFSDVSQAKPLILNRAQSLSMSDQSETDDWDPPSPPARRQPLLKLDIRPRTSLGELDGALSPREAVPQPPVSRPLRALTPTLTDITETEGDLREEPLQVAAALGQLARYSHNFGGDNDDEDAAEEKTSPRSPTPPVSPNADRKVQMWQQYVELQHAADDEPSTPQPLSTSDIMYLYIESAAGATSTSELSDIGLSAAVPRHEHRASAVRLERTVSADCVRRRRQAGLARCSSADGLLQRGRPPVDIANIIALGRLPLASPEPRDDAESDERGRGKKCVSWSDLHGSGELEVIHGSPDGEPPQQLATRSDSEASSSGEESDEEPDLVVGGSRHQQPPTDFGLTMPDEVRRRARHYLPQHTQPAQLETANWDLIGQDIGIPLVERQNVKRVANAATQTLRDASSQTDCIEETTPPLEHTCDAQADQHEIPQLSSESHGYPYSSSSNYNAYLTSRAYDTRNSFNNPGLRSDPHVYNIHTSSNYDSFSRSHYPPYIPSESQRYSFEYTNHQVYPDHSTAPLNTSGSRAGSLERQIRRELASLRHERERSQGHWDGNMERHRRLLQVETSLQKSLQQMRALVARRRARARVLMETVPPFQPSSRHSRMSTALPAYRQTTVVPSAGVGAMLAEVGGSYDKVDYEYDSGGLDYTGRLREAPSVTHVLHQEIHVPPCCNHSPAPARPAAAAGSPRRMTPSQYRQHLAAIRRRILAQPPGSAVQPPPLLSGATPDRGRRRVDPWSTSDPTGPGHSALTRSEPDLSRAGGVWRSDVPASVAGSTVDLRPRLYDTEGGFTSTEASRARYGMF